MFDSILNRFKNIFLKSIPRSTEQALILNEVLTSALEHQESHIKHGLKPNENKTWNPILKYPRNEECYCGSNIKFKKCCMLSESKEIEIASANDVAKHVKTIRGK